MEFGADTLISVTGTELEPALNGQPIAMWEAVPVKEGHKIKFSHFSEFGFRSYLGVAWRD